MPQQTTDQPQTRKRVSDLSDSMLKQRLLNALLDTGYVALQSIRVTVKGRTAVLSGAVETYHLKQLAGSVVTNTADFEHIDNSIVVV